MKLWMKVVPVLVAAVTMLALAPTASASTSVTSDSGVNAQSAPIPDCLNVGLTRRVWDHYINGYGSNSCGRDGEIAIERYEWFGWWPIKREFLGAHGFDVAVSYDCRGTGTWKYRTSVTLYPRQKFSNVITENC